MSGVREAGGAVVVRNRNPGTYGIMGYATVLKSLDGRIDKLGHVQDEIVRLKQGARVMLGLWAFSEELVARLWGLRKAIGLECRPE
jgi:hypothetical protein